MGVTPSPHLRSDAPYVTHLAVHYGEEQVVVPVVVVRARVLREDDADAACRVSAYLVLEGATMQTVCLELASCRAHSLCQKAHD